MASIQEQIDEAKKSVKYWDDREEPQIRATQAAKRAWERKRGMATARAWHKEQRALARIRDKIAAANRNLSKVEAEYHKMTPLDRQDSYWKDRVQDLKRERHRLCLMLGSLRRYDRDERMAASGEIAAVADMEGVSADDKLVGAWHPQQATEGQDDELGEFMPVEDTYDVMLFTAKPDRTTMEQRLEDVNNLLHHAKLMLARIRKREEALKGGDIKKFVAVVMQAANIYYRGNRRHTFYSQGGRWTVMYEPEGPPYGFRSDCSSFVTACAHKAGIPDPNGEGYRYGFTGTLVSHCKSIGWGSLRPGDLIIYGPGDGHHVEIHVGPGQRTVGHGSPPVDFGSDHMISYARPFRIPT